MTRVYQPVPLKVGQHLQLDEAASHHLARVLRITVQDKVVLFNGEGGEYSAVVSQIDKKRVTVEVQDFSAREVESPLDIILVQGISRGEKMDYTIQKAVELGVKQVIPVFTERCNVKLDAERSDKRTQHWQSVVVSACEQSGRNRVPLVSAPQALSAVRFDAEFCFVLSPHAEKNLSELTISPQSKVVLLIGPEGGLSDREINNAIDQGFTALKLGPRVLRTETAALTAISALQTRFGDL